ncbi:4-(cytidine 5'-diphospho)-2-C-methyl-D-erythritol kinase [Albidovulum sediminis]|uniref:4-diphosphocytidyl-2-C-methyl-D-erythritol kinase n=1 Tax=Albidovulum sediminis TaxID=3066345 RepID=A0ABT2NQ04_9RHOB|nr:4-(cytidine 5'-diphospho)-2-C-methyl-D-erythritol kinase [Defluviimonas sediminis]MCT8331016.1 4-(cytidine 5'-diphospho)-2-C-methyl-D-erythritol kinase [Defluviimonas sediminis]
MTTEDFAPAKVNLALHVTGRRADGYHLLDSLVVFAGVGDRLAVTPGPELRLIIDGPMAGALTAEPDNLVLRAARFLGEERVVIRLTKHLPVASGIGGGSADAAAAIRAICRLRGRALPEAALTAPLGADVPVCLIGRPARVQGIGERVEPLSGLPPAHLVLANPGVSLATPAVFGALRRRDGAPLPPLPPLADVADLARYLATCRNDLEDAACALEPVIGEVIGALGDQPGCLLSRMSGSGATCFGLFADRTAATEAAAALRHRQPGWWVEEAAVLS